MTRKPTSLSDVMAKKQTASQPASEPSSDSEALRTLTLRLKPIVHDQLREMAFTARKSQHSLLMEALNDLFQKHGKPPIAL
jgi:predicted HicB family RNase H-like nuclease